MDSNTITSIGVFLILLAYWLNTYKNLSKNTLYFLLNIFGSILAGIGAYMVRLWPTVLLEIIWAGISLLELFKIKKNQL